MTKGASNGSGCCTRAGPADPLTPPEPADDLVGVVAEDVAHDLLAVVGIDGLETGPEQADVVLLRGLGQGRCTGRVLGVGVPAPEQGDPTDPPARGAWRQVTTDRDRFAS